MIKQKLLKQKLQLKNYMVELNGRYYQSSAAKEQAEASNCVRQQHLQI